MTPAPRRFGSNYVLGDVLAVGGMGIVHTAIQRSLDRTVALKLPRPELAGDPAILERFRIEALAGSRVNHRNVVRVLDFGRCEGTPFLVMDHIVGPRLGDVLLDCGRISAGVAVALVEQLLAGLAEAHACGVVHGDVKCDNILVETQRDGTAVARLIDFGIARFVGTRQREAPLEVVVAGTPEYLAPELIIGGPSSFASDVYAAAVILYELITGATPFAGGSSPEIMERAISERAPPMSWRSPDCEISMELDEVVGQALAPNPKERFANATAFRVALASATGVVAAPMVVPKGTPPRGTVSTSTPTARIGQIQILHLDAHDATPEQRSDARIQHHRSTLAAMLPTNDGDAIVVAYLGIARVYVEQHQLDAAIAELESAVALLSRATDKARRAPVWRLLLTLAALYDGRGDRAMARETTRDARDHAIGASSNLGRERADRLWARLSHVGMPARRRSAW